MGNFFAELKRRNVFRMALLYSIAAWLILQVAEVLIDLARLPDWLGPIVLGLLAIGFPIALLLSWLYEITPTGIVLEKEIVRAESITHLTGRRLDFIVIALLAAAVILFAFDKWGGGEPRQQSIAVLPFVDLSPAGDQEYFSDGIAEEILNVLAKVPNLKVTGRTSSFQFKGQNKDLRLIGDLLNVDHVLEGSIRKDGNRIRITVQLNATDDGFHLWSETYDRELVDIFAIQDQISKAVVEALKIQLGAGEEIVVEQKTDSLEAYDIYLRGRQLLRLRRADIIEKAIELFDEVTVLDPEFSNAWSAQGRAYGILPNYMLETGEFLTFYEKGKKAAGRALELDPANAEAYSALNFINLGMHEWREAEINNAKAIALAPYDAEIANFAGDHYRILFDTVNAVKWEGRAYELDPLHQVNSWELGLAYLDSGDFENALKLFNIAVDLDSSAFRQQAQIFALAELARYEEAHEILTQWKAKPPYFPFLILDSETFLFIREGRVEEARANIEKMGQLVLAGQGVSALPFRRFLELCEIEAALFWFERGFEEHDPYLFLQGNMLPENYTDDPELLARFNRPGMKELFDIRRRNIAKNAAEVSGSDRSPITTVFGPGSCD